MLKTQVQYSFGLLWFSSGFCAMNRRLRVAIADDKSEMRQYLSKILWVEGHRVVVAAQTGGQLIRECHLEQPDLVITDIEMPDGDGLHAIHEICSSRVVPAIVVSAKSGHEQLARASDELVFAFLVKPIKMDDLRPAIWITMRRFEELTSLRTKLAAYL